MKVKMRFLPIVVLAILFSSAMAKTDNRIVLTESESQAHLNSASDEQWQLQMIKAQFAWDMGADVIRKIILTITGMVLILQGLYLLFIIKQV